MAPLVAVSGCLWELLGSSWGHLGASWAGLGMSWGRLGPWGTLGAGALGASLGVLGSSWGCLRTLLGRSWGRLGLSRACLGTLLGLLGLHNIDPEVDPKTDWISGPIATAPNGSHIMLADVSKLGQPQPYSDEIIQNYYQKGYPCDWCLSMGTQLYIDVYGCSYMYYRRYCSVTCVYIYIYICSYIHTKNLSCI